MVTCEEMTSCIRETFHGVTGNKVACKAVLVEWGTGSAIPTLNCCIHWKKFRAAEYEVYDLKKRNIQQGLTVQEEHFYVTVLP